jgi:hypothetical protein
MMSKCLEKSLGRGQIEPFLFQSAFLIRTQSKISLREMSSDKDKMGQSIWKQFRESPSDYLKAQSFIPEANMLFSESALCFDSGAFEAVAILCRSTLESAFLAFLSIEWHDNNFFNISYPTTLDGKPRRVEFEELENGINQRIDFPEEQKKAISRIQRDGNFVAHFASTKIKQRFKLSKDLKEWETSNENVTALERIAEVTELYQSVRHWITRDEALADLRDTLSILLTVCNAMKLDLS